MRGEGNMADHYYTNDPSSKRDPKTWEYVLRGQTLRFTSDHGVFSKNGIDFGSRLLIEAFTEPPVAGDILDDGCGYGPMGIALSKSTGRPAHLIDVNERALELAADNARANGVSVTTGVSDGYDGVGESTFAAIVTNPPIRAGKTVVHRILREAYDHLVVGGELWVVIQKKQGGPSAKKLMEDVFGMCETVTRDKGYSIFKSIRS